MLVKGFVSFGWLVDQVIQVEMEYRLTIMDLSVIASGVTLPQEAWNEKVLVSSFQDF